MKNLLISLLLLVSTLSISQVYKAKDNTGSCLVIPPITTNNFTPSGSITTVHVLLEDEVYICTGKYAKTYHRKICGGAKNCKAEIEKVSKAEAEEMKRTPCGTCYK